MVRPPESIFLAAAALIPPCEWGPDSVIHVDIVKDQGHVPPVQDRSAARNTNQIWLLIALIALTPSMMAAITWTPDNHFSVGLYLIRFLAPPVLMVEMLVIGFAMRSGFNPIAYLVALPARSAIALAGLVAIAFSTALFVAPDANTAVFRGAIALCHLLFGLSIFSLMKMTRFSAYRALWIIMIVASAAYALTMIAFISMITDYEHYDWLHFGLGVVNIRHTGFYIVPGVALTLGLIANERRASVYWLGVAILTLCFAVHFWSGSRAPILTILGSCCISAILLPQLRTRKLAIALVVSLICGAALSVFNIPNDGAYGVFRIFSTAADPAVDASSGRLPLWQSTIEAIWHHPLFGVGESQFIAVVPGAREILHHPHNAILQILVQWGIVGLVLMAALTITLWRKLFIIAMARSDEIAPAFLAINALLLYSLVDGVFYFIYPMMILTFLVAVCLSAGRDGGGEAPYSERPAP